MHISKWVYFWQFWQFWQSSHCVRSFLSVICFNKGRQQLPACARVAAPVNQARSCENCWVVNYYSNKVAILAEIITTAAAPPLSYKTICLLNIFRIRLLSKHNPLFYYDGRAKSMGGPAPKTSCKFFREKKFYFRRRRHLLNSFTWMILTNI